MAQVVNLKTYTGAKDQVVYIGRYFPKWGNSMWGNRWESGVHGTTEEIITMYRDDLKTNEKRLAALPALKEQIQAGKVLGCWCKPAPCHGDVLLEFMGLPNKEVG